MNIRTFLGASEDKVIAQIKQAFGRDAVILSTRRVKREGLMGLMGRTVIEVEACSGRDVARTKMLARRIEPSFPGGGGGTAAASSAASLSAGGEILRELQYVKSAIVEMAGRVRGDVPDLTPELQEAYQRLVENEVAKDIACAIVKSLNEKLSRDQLKDPEILRTHLRAVLEERLPTSGPIVVPGGRAKRVVFVGPTGVGKTTTVAKVAARMHLREKVSVGLITIDTYRLAAVEQLRSYANILKIPLRVADSPAELGRSVQDFSGHDVTLIDTAGRSQHDTLRLNELKLFLDAARPDEVHLVMSLTANAKAMCRTIENFMPLGVTQIVLTKLDEIETFGLILNVMARVDRKLSYVTFGQSVPDDIEPGRSGRLARLILREEPLPGVDRSVFRGMA